MRNLIVELPSGEKVEMTYRKAKPLIDACEARLIGWGAGHDASKQAETMELPTVGRRGRPRKGE